MKKLITLLTLFVTLAAFSLSAGVYTVDRIPNVHLSDSTLFVSNPDGILSPEAQAEADNMLRGLMASTSAEVVAVVVDDIDPDADINDFATDLFRAWGLGKKDKNNGGLLLVAKDRRRYVFRTGSGLEGLLPDGLLGSIMREEMRPRFREGDYDGGVLATLSAVSGILSDPVAAEEIRSKYANNASDDEPDGFQIYLVISAIITAVLLVVLIVTMINVRSRTRYDRYLAADKLFTPTFFLTFAALGMPLVVLLPLLLWRHRLRRGTHKCPDCGTPMRIVDEVHDNDYLTRAQDIEEQIGAVDYDVWLCPKCGETEVIPYVIRSSAYQQCPVCHARTLRTVSDRIVRQPTQLSTGLRVISRHCVNCGHDDNETKIIPKIAPVVIVGGAGSGGSSGGFGGGSFGGGFTAGGGASGGW